MAEEPTDLALTVLREIRETQLEHGRRLEAIDRRFDEPHETVHTAMSFATHAHVRCEATEKRMNAFERSLAKLEEKA